jgi:hypothetical protein
LTVRKWTLVQSCMFSCWFADVGCSQIQLILAHLRTQKNLHNQIICLLESYQVLAGNTTPALKNIDPIIYVHSPLTNTVRQFLLQIDATITITKLQTIQCIRQYDKAIMDSTNLSLYSKSEQEMINACRLFLKVNTLAEITNHQGNKILECVHDCALSLEGHPTLNELSELKLQWPYQTRPPRKARLLWKHYHHFLEKPIPSSNALAHGITIYMHNGHVSSLLPCQAFCILTTTLLPGTIQYQVAPDIDYSSLNGT